MKIASVSTLFPTRAEPEYGIFVARRLAALAARAKVRLLHPVPWFPLVRPYSRARQCEPEVNGIPVVNCRMPYLPGIWKSRDSEWLRRCVQPVLRNWQRDAGIGLIDAHFGFPEGQACVEAGQALGLPVFVTLRGVEQELANDRRIGPAMIHALRSAAGCIAVSESLKDAVVLRGVPEERVRVIPNAVDSRIFYPGDRQAARRLVGSTSPGPIILFVGHLNERKGVHNLIQAFAEAAKVHREARLVLVGGETYNEPLYAGELKKLVRKSGLESSVDFAGRMSPEQVGHWMRAADVFAIASRREGCCNVVLEALACGMSVVATDVGDNARFVTAGRGAIVPPGDPSAFAAGLMNALSSASPELRHESGARRTWDDVTDETMEFFSERLQGRQALPSAALAVSHSV